MIFLSLFSRSRKFVMFKLKFALKNTSTLQPNRVKDNNVFLKNIFNSQVPRASYYCMNKGHHNELTID